MTAVAQPKKMRLLDRFTEACFIWCVAVWNHFHDVFYNLIPFWWLHCICICIYILFSIWNSVTNIQRWHTHTQYKAIRNSLATGLWPYFYMPIYPYPFYSCILCRVCIYGICTATHSFLNPKSIRVNSIRSILNHFTFNLH